MLLRFDDALVEVTSLIIKRTIGSTEIDSFFISAKIGETPLAVSRTTSYENCQQAINEVHDSFSRGSKVVDVRGIFNENKFVLTQKGGMQS